MLKVGLNVSNLSEPDEGHCLNCEHHAECDHGEPAG